MKTKAGRAGFFSFNLGVVRRSAIWAASIYGGMLATLSFCENYLVFVPSKFPAGIWTLPSGADEVTFKSSDGVGLHGWYFPQPNANAVCLFHHGNGGNLTSRRDLAEQFRTALNCSILLYDYRGYGKSEGAPSEAGVLKDARAARAWLASKEGVAEQSIVMIGESLGGGVAVDLAAKDGARGLILLNTFTSLPDVAAKKFYFVPARWIMRTRFDSRSKIGNYRGPLLQYHWNRDNVVPFTLGQMLFKAANEPKLFVTGSGMDHTMPPSDDFYTAAREWVSKLPPSR